MKSSSFLVNIIRMVDFPWLCWFPGGYLKKNKKWFWQRRPLWRLHHSTFFSDVVPKLWLLLAVFVKGWAEGIPGEASTKNTAAIYLVVSNIFYFHPYLGKWSNLPNIFRRGWNHQLVIHESLPGLHQEDSRVQIAAVRYKVRRIRSRSRGPDPMLHPNCHYINPGIGGCNVGRQNYRAVVRI